ncbi:MAG: hypothetical protein C0606_12640 [Hyphomicrobiales bacterium]|nr:MAG: hypothetical protein C0606_12640 [Hyphomicrobiales bacterium]
MTLSKLAILRLYAAGLGLFTLFWWPLSHWFFPDWYHDLMGFESYDLAFVRLIGTMGLLPVGCLFWLAYRPREAYGFLVVFVVWSLLLAATFAFLILFSGFPQAEFGNVALLVMNAAILGFLAPSVPRKRR